jgi:hypothetical protein
MFWFYVSWSEAKRDQYCIFLMEDEFPPLRITRLPAIINFKATYTHSGFQLIGSLVDWGSHLFGANTGQHKQIKNVTRICFSYLGHHTV